MQIVIASVGSLGDVHPFIAIGQALQARGHAVTLLTNDDFGALVQSAGLVHASAGRGVDLAAAVASPNLWDPMKGLGVFWKHMLAPAIEPCFRQIEAIAARGPCAVLAPPVMFGARFARDRLGVPLVSAYTAPAVLRSDGAPLTMAHWRLPRGTPRSLVRLAWQALDRHKLHPMARRPLDDIAARLDTAPPPLAQSIFGEWMHSPDGGVTLFPDWFAPARPGWPAALRVGGFPLYAADAQGTLPSAVSRFLAAGTPPIVFMPGSAMQHASAFFAAAVGACRQLGRRGLLLTPHAQQLPVPLPAEVKHVGYLPFAALLPQAAALVHHGGIGSCAQALHAGVPQVIMPMAHDQFDNAACVARLGLGRTLRPAAFSAERLAGALAGLFAASPERWQQSRQRLASPALGGICEAVEALVAAARPGGPGKTKPATQVGPTGMP
jgi:rhamnosyltransferase subunit B